MQQDKKDNHHDHKHDHEHDKHEHKHKKEHEHDEAEKHKHHHEHEKHEHHKEHDQHEGPKHKHHHDKDHKPPHILLEEKTKELNDANLKYLMLLAEVDNQRKRFDIEKNEYRKYANISFLQDFMPTFDLFEKVLHTQNVSKELSNWFKGFEMIYSQMKNHLEDLGVKKINSSKGQEVNPNLHHVIDEVETSEVEDGRIFEVKNNGYLLHDRLIVAATVTVAKNDKNKGN